MLLEIHNTIQQLIHEHGQISPLEVDITFDTPTHELIDKLTRPTINLFLFELQENTDLRQSDFESARNNGRGERRMPPRRFDLHYMVSILTTELEDAQQLLWRVLLTLVRYPHFPAELLSAELRSLVPPLTTRLGQVDDGQRLAGLWPALGIPPRAALSYVVTVPVDMNLVIEAPLVMTRTTRFTHKHDPLGKPDTSTQIGGIVRDPAGTPLADVNVAIEGSAAYGCNTNHEGHFILKGVPSGTVKLRLTRTDGTQKVVTVAIPQPHPDIPSGQSQVIAPTQPYDIVLDFQS
jgi:hypothetical protein